MSRQVGWTGFAAMMLALLAAWAWPAGQAAKSPTARFGDAVLSNFESAELDIGSRARVTGPNTTIDLTDAARRTKAKIQANEIVALMAQSKPTREQPRSRTTVERVDATGNVRFSAVRTPASGTGSQTVRASGSKAVYERAKQLLTLDGPVKFSAEQPAADGSGTETVTGTATRAIYDEGKRSLRLFGSVEATVNTPDTPEEGSTFSGDEVHVDMSVEPYRVTISNPSLKGSINIRVKDQERTEPERK